MKKSLSVLALLLLSLPSFAALTSCKCTTNHFYVSFFTGPIPVWGPGNPSGYVTIKVTSILCPCFHVPAPDHSLKLPTQGPGTPPLPLTNNLVPLMATNLTFGDVQDIRELQLVDNQAVTNGWANPYFQTMLSFSIWTSRDLSNWDRTYRVTNYNGLATCSSALYMHDRLMAQTVSTSDNMTFTNGINVPWGGCDRMFYKVSSP